VNVSTTGGSGGRRLADRLAAARHARFVGRAAELDLFTSALSAADPPFAVLYLHGPGGVGKTALLGEYELIAQRFDLAVTRLDGHQVEPSPAGFLEALARSRGAGDEAATAGADIEDLDPFADPRERAVLMIDTFEALAPLERWFSEEFLPRLPCRVLVVVAGRNPPSLVWRGGPGWEALLRVVPMRNLDPSESRAYLAARGLLDERQDRVIGFTHGHPFALALVADLLSQGLDPGPLWLDREPDLVRTLLDRFVERVPTIRHRLALEVCAHLRVTTEEMLAVALGADDAPEVFDWLRGLSFMESGPQGLYPHDLARDVLETDLRWRNPEAYRQLHCSIRTAIVRRVQLTHGVEQQRAVSDLLFMHRHGPSRAYFDWETLGTIHSAPAAPDDLTAILDMVRAHEGEAAAAIALRWFIRQPDAFSVARDHEGAIIGFEASIALHHAAEDDLAADPAAAAAARYARRFGPLRPGDEMLYQRFCVGRDTYQDVSAVTNLRWASWVRRTLTGTNLAWVFVAVADAARWRGLLTDLRCDRAPEADFSVGGREYAVFVHDWRAEPLQAWLELVAEQELAAGATACPVERPAAAPLVVLSREEFESAVRQGLRDCTRPEALGGNPLLRSRLVVDQAGPGPLGTTLQELLRQAAESLRGNPRGEKLYRAIHRTYLAPAANQQLAAEALGLPFSTYRSHLGAATAEITEWLWQRELNGNA
jgi:hypothetical protein